TSRSQPRRIVESDFAPRRRAMRSSWLALAALTAAVITGAAYGKRILPLPQQAPARPAGQAVVSDPAEPQLKGEGAARTSGLVVASSARGTSVRVNTTQSWQGSASLSFKGCAPPMRLTLTLAQMQQYDLGSLTLTSGRLSLAVGRVSSAPTTRYFDAS